MRLRGIQAIGAAAAFATLAGCASLDVGDDVADVRNIQGTGDAFTRALTQEYSKLAVFEADEMFDWDDAEHFAEKAKMAQAGETVLPDALDSRDIPDNRVGELSAARAELVSLLDASARTKVPDLAARAQGRFDCWLEQQEENFQGGHIATCRAQFYDALERVKAAMAGRPAAAVPDAFVVFFAFDRSNLTPASLAVIDEAIAAARAEGAADFSITGHADRAGPSNYNVDLSLRRANAVRDALLARGVSPSQISVAARGESEPAVPTADGVREPANRRVEIILLQQ